MEYPKISIITPSYNQGKFLEETINSILSQNYPQLEYIIIDGGSSDNSVDIIKKYEKYLTYWVSEKDNGQSHAINKGLIKATGEVFNWINSDDFLEKDSLKTIGEYFACNKEINLLCGFTRIFDNETNSTIQYYRMGIKNTPEETIVKPYMNQMGSFFRMNVIKEMGLLNEGLHFVMDLELWLKYIFRYGFEGIVFTDKFLAQFRSHGNCKSINNSEEMLNERAMLFYHIAKQIGTPDYIVKELRKDINGDNYYNSDDWFLENNIATNKISAYFCNNYVQHFYENRQYNEAKEAFSYCMENLNI
ncbi:MAG: glycosyltransferase family 2 protein, partial [Bacteroidota bacterium]|nr:glycosyltransferase family 2 protein [Bacteroidota bacterium]